MKFNSKRAHDLLERLTQNPVSPKAGAIMSDALDEFHRGYPLEHLRPLLCSTNDDLVVAGAWIASELGVKGKPLLGDVLPLLGHRSRGARFWTIDCVLLWAGPSDGRALASAVRLVDDVDQGVRWNAMDFLSRASVGQLHAALAYLESSEPPSPNIAPLRWLLGGESSDPEKVLSALRSEDRLLRKYGVVAAVKMSSGNPRPLFAASSNEDPDVAKFAQSGIQLLRAHEV